MTDVIRIHDDWYVRASSSRADLQTRSLKHGEAFGIFDRFGDIQHIGVGEQGIFYEGTRFLSYFEMLVNERRPMLLSSSVSSDNTLLTVDLTTPDLYREGKLYLRKGVLHIFRSKFLWNGVCHEHVRIVNYSTENISIDLSILFDADYADIFEIRGVERAGKGTKRKTAIKSDHAQLGYDGLDGLHYQTVLRFDLAPDNMTVRKADYNLSLSPGVPAEFYIGVTCVKGEEKPKPVGYDHALVEQRERVIGNRAAFVDVFSSNEQFNDWLERSAADLRLLITETEHGLYPYAGIPWFCTPFGRDGIITALQCLWIYPELARGVLSYLSHTQATEFSAENDAEPGKILHETRKGEMATLKEIPFARYYGSVDATPLYTLLAGRYFARTADLDFIRSIWPNLCNALDWINTHGDIDNDGFVEYERKSPNGILQQGWKDSNDSIFHADGTVAGGPIALCEVQGYVYEAKLHMARLAGHLGENGMAARLTQEAIHLKKQFHDLFWLEDLQTYAIALDGEKKPCRIRSSNAGHALFCGIADEKRAGALVRTLMSRESFNSWGIRTIAAGEQHYNPMSYHNGSVWPHDNAIIAMGMAQYGFKDEATTILTGLFNTAIAVDLHRLPELFCGFERRQGQEPTLYPVACAPQAWASGAVFMLLQACLGMTFSHQKPEIRFNSPRLPDYINSIRISRLQTKRGEVDLILRRHTYEVSIHVERRTGDVEVAVVM